MTTSADWWLFAEGRVFGPYERSQLAGFLRRGRMAASSRMGRSRQGPFAPAKTWPELADLFHTAGASASTPDPDAERALIVLASLRETSMDALHAALLTFGTAVRVRGTLWACRAKLSATGLRNALSRQLGPGEFLFVAEVEGAATAWFNLDPEVDRTLRRLWNGDPRKAEPAPFGQEG